MGENNNVVYALSNYNFNYNYNFNKNHNQENSSTSNRTLPVPSSNTYIPIENTAYSAIQQLSRSTNELEYGESFEKTLQYIKSVVDLFDEIGFD